jgi:hypothetical protein
VEDVKCFGEHRFFAVEVVANQSAGKVWVLALCTACGEFLHHELAVGHSGDSIRLMLEEKKKG